MWRFQGWERWVGLERGSPLPHARKIPHAKNGIWTTTGGTRKITVFSSTFYGVNSNFYAVHSVKCTGGYRNFSSATSQHQSPVTSNYSNAVFCVQGQINKKKELKEQYVDYLFNNTS